MNVCEICGKPIPRTKKICEECAKGIQAPDPLEEEDEDFKDEEEGEEDFD